MKSVALELQRLRTTVTQTGVIVINLILMTDYFYEIRRKESSTSQNSRHAVEHAIKNCFKEISLPSANR